MNKLSKNTAAVLVLTLFTGLAVFSAIQLGGRVFGTSTASAATTQTTAQQSTNGAVQQTDPYGNGYGYGQGQSSTQQTDPYGYGQGSGSSSGSSSGQTYTCPATGCTASTCHATQ